MINIKKKYGKNAILKGMNLVEGGTTIERAAGKQVELFCNLEITKGEAEIFIISGSNEPKTLIKTTGTYENTITLPDGSNYIGIVGNDFSGTVKIEVK